MHLYPIHKKVSRYYVYWLNEIEKYQLSKIRISKIAHYL